MDCKLKKEYFRPSLHNGSNIDIPMHRYMDNEHMLIIEVIMAVTTEIKVFWNVTLYSYID